MRVALLIVFCFCITSTNPSRVFAETPTEKIGVIVLHPKWSMPAKILSDFQWYDQEERFRKFQTWCDTGPWVCSDDQIIVANERNDSSILTIDFYEEGFLLTSPQCAWSKFKQYNLTVDESLKKAPPPGATSGVYQRNIGCVTSRIKWLKSLGAEKIVVLGKSLGANAAIRAGVVIEGIDAIVAMAPGHRPEMHKMRLKHEADVSHAREKFNSGNGQEIYLYLDSNQGDEKDVEVSAENYLSWFDPEGKAVMELNAPKIKGNIPFLWIAGESDFISDGTGKYIYDSVPPNPKSKFIYVEGGHGDVRENGRDIIIDWIKAL